MASFLEQLREDDSARFVANENQRQATETFQKQLQFSKFKVYEVVGNNFTRPAGNTHNWDELQSIVIYGESRDIVLILEILEDHGTVVFTAFSLTDGQLWRFSLPAITVFEPRPDIRSHMLQFVAQCQTALK